MWSLTVLFWCISATYTVPPPVPLSMEFRLKSTYNIALFMPALRPSSSAGRPVPYVCILPMVAHTIHVISCECETSVSAFCRLKDYMCQSIGKGCPSYIALLCIPTRIQEDHDEFVNLYDWFHTCIWLIWSPLCSSLQWKYWFWSSTNIFLTSWILICNESLQSDIQSMLFLWGGDHTTIVESIGSFFLSFVQ